MFSNFSTLHLYNHDGILIFASLKCGTRFIKDTQLFTEVEFGDDIESIIGDAKEIYWVVRNPLEKFLSATITDLNYKYLFSNSKSTKVKIKKNDEAFIIKNLGDFLDLIESDNTIDNYNSHYEDLYVKTYSLITTYYKLFYKTRFVKLEDLSDLIKYKFKCNFKFEEKRYSFDINGRFITKNEIADMFETHYLEKWNLVLDKLSAERLYYDKLCEFNFNDFIKQKKVELEDKLKVKEFADARDNIYKISIYENLLKTN